MPQLVVRNLDALLVRRLKERAVKHGVSAEEEHRRILQAALQEQQDSSGYDILKEVLMDERFAHIDVSFERIKEVPKDIDLS